MEILRPEQQVMQAAELRRPAGAVDGSLILSQELCVVVGGQDAEDLDRVVGISVVDGMGGHRLVPSVVTSGPVVLHTVDPTADSQGQ